MTEINKIEAPVWWCWQDRGSQLVAAARANGRKPNGLLDARSLAKILQTDAQTHMPRAVLAAAGQRRPATKTQAASALFGSQLQPTNQRPNSNLYHYYHYHYQHKRPKHHQSATNFLKLCNHCRQPAKQAAAFLFYCRQLRTFFANLKC